jgi:U3 small nucleolar RNA-associated protein 22
MLRSYDHVFSDRTGSINLFAGWDKGDIDLVSSVTSWDASHWFFQTNDTQIRLHARETLVMLEDSSVDCFAEVFLKNHTLSMGVFDDVFQYVIPASNYKQHIADLIESRLGMLESRTIC